MSIATMRPQATKAARIQRSLIIALAVIAGNLSVEIDRFNHIVGIGLTQSAEARGGGRGGAHSVRPGGVVGAGNAAARRTARRVSRRWAIGTRLTTLPPDCVWSNGGWYCAEDGVYFQQTTENNTVTYICQ